MGHNKIKISLPLIDRDDVVQKVIDLYCQKNNTKKLINIVREPKHLVNVASNKNLSRDASKIADLVRLASMHIE